MTMGADISSDRVYANSGNIELLKLLDENSGTLLDIGCGAGDNARYLRTHFPAIKVTGITQSANEASLALAEMQSCLVANVENGVPGELVGQSFDVLLLSHVLEHLRDPAAVLSQYLSLLRPGGQVLIAVPNVLSWKMRIQFLFGDFNYRSDGVLDDTHLRFFTFFSAAPFLLSRSPSLRVVRLDTQGSVPLWWLRRKIISKRTAEKIDRWGCSHWPNLFGGQVLISARNGE